MNKCFLCEKFYKLPINRVINPHLGFCKLYNETVDQNDSCDTFHKANQVVKDRDYYINQAIAKRLKIVLPFLKELDKTLPLDKQLDLFQ